MVSKTQALKERKEQEDLLITSERMAVESVCRRAIWSVGSKAFLARTADRQRSEEEQQFDQAPAATIALQAARLHAATSTRPSPPPPAGASLPQAAAVAGKAEAAAALMRSCKLRAVAESLLSSAQPGQQQRLLGCTLVTEQQPNGEGMGCWPDPDQIPNTLLALLHGGVEKGACTTSAENQAAETSGDAAAEDESEGPDAVVAFNVASSSSGSDKGKGSTHAVRWKREKLSSGGSGSSEAKTVHTLHSQIKPRRTRRSDGSGSSEARTVLTARTGHSRSQRFSGGGTDDDELYSSSFESDVGDGTSLSGEKPAAQPSLVHFDRGRLLAESVNRAVQAPRVVVSAEAQERIRTLAYEAPPSREQVERLLRESQGLRLLAAQLTTNAPPRPDQQ